ncbi:uncharacterized protein F4807DRAFT_438210 [Annulohypoxylon truncatum]|uniref:uncharacterized protein n=1 Tax=Annulohypoxylon truncatum TaxID=327061 RepID=UPI0020079D9C|nr:uncharacterized protein F4807DRAFT_438210 [Annulohypoxylon truncatum]KAI1206764.1 hypothetical protein F4807DRAFT_438210 [Annulohypoxylon truncatum]
MAAVFDLNTYKCTYLPKTLWRVTDSESRSMRDPITRDHVAENCDRTISDKSGLKQAVEDHFNWSC